MSPQPQESEPDPDFERFLAQRATPGVVEEVARLNFCAHHDRRYRPKVSLRDASVAEVERGHALVREYLDSKVARQP